MQTRTAERRALVADRVHEHQLTGAVVREQRLVVRRGQQILIRAHRRHAAAVFLHVRTGRRHRRRPAPRRGRSESRCTAAGCRCPPTCTGVAKTPFSARPGTAWAPSGGRVADPQLDGRVARMREREADAVGREAQPRDRRRGRQGDRARAAPSATVFIVERPRGARAVPAVVARDRCAAPPGAASVAPVRQSTASARDRARRPRRGPGSGRHPAVAVRRGHRRWPSAA